MHVGLDFGTTNSALARAASDRTVQLARFPRGAGGETSASFRSLLYFHPERRGPRNRLEPVIGPDAIEAYLEADGDGRLIQSFKSYLASRTFTATSIFGKAFTLEDLISTFLTRLRERVPVEPGERVVVGRPVRFSHAENEADDDFAVERLRGALTAADFRDVRFEYEPVAAAYFYERRLDRDEQVLIADFGGGTSDFCLINVGPSFRGRARGGRSIVGTEGVAIAGDSFDAELIQHLVAPSLGLGSEYRSYLEKDQTRTQVVPSWIFGRLRRWHHLSFLKSPETMRFLEDLRAQSLEPDKIAALIHVVEDDLGYRLYQAIEQTKLELSRAEQTTFVFDEDPLIVKKKVTRKQFERWIADPLAQFEGAVERLLARTGVTAAQVDRVFLTGGSSLVPAVREVFRARFGEAKLAGGDELTSVAQGLALSALDG